MKSTTTLQQVIQEIKNDPATRNRDDDMVIMKELCKKIQTEEDKKIDTKVLEYMREHGPSGTAVLLTLSIPYQRNPKEFSYLTLEHDPLSGWSVCYYIDFGQTGSNKLKKRHDIESVNPNHIMTRFAKIYKEYLGK
jgi:hypothetical protein